MPWPSSNRPAMHLAMENVTGNHIDKFYQRLTISPFIWVAPWAYDTPSPDRTGFTDVDPGILMSSAMSSPPPPPLGTAPSRSTSAEPKMLDESLMKSSLAIGEALRSTMPRDAQIKRENYSLFPQDPYGLPQDAMAPIPGDIQSVLPHEKAHATKFNEEANKRVKNLDVANWRSELTEVVQPTQLPDGRFKCPACDKCFKYRKHVRRHYLGHTNFRPFTCNYCGQEFHRLDSCSRHLSRCNVKKRADLRKGCLSTL